MLLLILKLVRPIKNSKTVNNRQLILDNNNYHVIIIVVGVFGILSHDDNKDTLDLCNILR